MRPSGCGGGTDATATDATATDATASETRLQAGTKRRRRPPGLKPAGPTQSMTMDELYELRSRWRRHNDLFDDHSGPVAVKKLSKAFRSLRTILSIIESDTATVADRIERSDTGNINAGRFAGKDNSGKSTTSSCSTVIRLYYRRACARTLTNAAQIRYALYERKPLVLQHECPIPTAPDRKLVGHSGGVTRYRSYTDARATTRSSGRSTRRNNLRF